jgi:hypothetical protein
MVNVRIEKMAYFTFGEIKKIDLILPYCGDEYTDRE